VTAHLRTPRVALLLACGLLAGGCAAWPRSWGPQPCCVNAKPAVKRQPVGWHLFDVTVVSQVKRTFNLARATRRVVGSPVRAMNLEDSYVPDSAFFLNGDPAVLTPEQVRWGPTRPDDIAQPPYTIKKAKTEGKTPGFFVTDARGVKYLFKLDPSDAPELLSGAEVVTSKLLHALGYYVPSYEIVRLRPEELRLEDGVMAKDAGGVPQPFTGEVLNQLVEPRLRDGLLRVGSSKILEGEILGPVPFKRFRDCAEVRALKVAYAWVNNIDAKDHNSLFVWDGQRAVAYLIDFGTSLGADAGLAAPKEPCEGWEYVVDVGEAAWDLMTLGMHRSGCNPRERPADASVGLFTARIDPDRWKPYVPNLAFQEMNRDDARWLTRRMARLSRTQIEAAVAAGHYSNPKDAAYLAETLDRRRQAIIERYLDDEELAEVMAR